MVAPQLLYIAYVVLYAHVALPDCTPATTQVRSALSVGVSQPDVPLLLSITLWATSGFDAVSLVSSEVSSPKTIPKAMLATVGMMVVATLGPILICCAAERGRVDWASYDTGSFSVAAER